MERVYRSVIEPEGLDCYRVVLEQSDLYVCTEGELREMAAEALREERGRLESYIERHPLFKTSLRPVPVTDDAPGIAREMAEAGGRFGVGPMSAVAGAIAQRVGNRLLGRSPRVIVENGGDIFLAGGGRNTVRVFTGKDSTPLDITVPVRTGGVGLCTSSGTVGHSLSFGRADAVVVLAGTATLADAAATALGNRVRSPEDIRGALDEAAESRLLEGVLVLCGGAMGAWGDIELVQAG